MKLLFLDLDGTVRCTKSGAKFINKPDDQKLIQGVEDAIAEQQYTISLLPKMRKIYFCSDFEGREGYLVKFTGKVVKVENPKYLGLLRKPNPGMLFLAQKSCLNAIEEILYVGDRPEDEQAAVAANIPFMWAEKWRSAAKI